MDASVDRPILRHLAVAAACASCAIYCSSLLMEDFNRPAGRGTGDPMATVEWQESSVRRKPPDTVLWADVADKDPLYKRDSVRTGADSGARIKLESGTVIELAENSLIMLEDTEDLSLNTLKGSMIVRGATGDTKVTVEADGKKVVEKLPIQLIAPERGTRMMSLENDLMPVKLIWRGASASPEGGELFLELSDQPSFSKPSKRIAVSKDQNEWSGELAAGRYYWRLVGSDSAATKNIPESVFEIESIHRPRLVGPLKDERIEILDETGSVQFRWIPTTHGLAYHVEVEGKELTSIGINGASGFALVRDLAEGDYRWKIVGERDGFRVESDRGEFSIKRAEKLSVSLASPDDDEVFEKLPTLRFAWHPPVLGQVNYRLRIRQKGAEQVLLEKTIESPVWVWSDVRAGNFEWEVVALSENGRTGGSGWREFSVFEGNPIALTSPEDGADIRYWKEIPEIALSWKSDSLTRSNDIKYKLEVASDSRFDHLVTTRPLSDTHAKVQDLGLLPGTYFWRVLLSDSAEKIIKSSAARKFVFGQHQSIAAPLATAPADGQVFDQSQGKQDPVLNWETKKDAKRYQVRVLDDRTKTMIREVETTDLSLAISGLAEGDYLWTVRAVDPLDREGEISPARSFKISWGDRIAGPELATLDRDERQLRWSEIPDSKGYVVEIGSREQEPVRFESASNHWTVPENVARGHHSVRVLAKDQFGREGRWSEPVDLVLSPEAIAAVQPQDGQEIPIPVDTAAVMFSWTKREGADRYRVEIFSEDKRIVSRETDDSDFESPRLDPGKYRWKVTPIVTSPDGKTWEIESQSEWALEVSRAPIARPKLIGPSGPEPGDGDTVTRVFEWAAVEGADGYVVRVRRMDDGGGLSTTLVKRRSPASAPRSVAKKGDAVLQIVTPTNRVEIDLPTDGEYSWEVRAVTTLKGVDEYGEASEVSEAKFTIDD